MIEKKSIKKLISRSNIYTKIKEKNRENTFQILSAAKQKRKIKSRLINVLTKKKSLSQKSNLVQFSYFSRFILKKKQNKRFFFVPNKDESNEVTLFNILKERFKKEEIKKKIISTKKFGSNIKGLSNRPFSLGVLYLKYLTKNLFANLRWLNTSAKASCGERYRGPKKKTLHAREAVLQKMASIVNNSKISTLDICITPYGKIYKHLCRMFFRTTNIYVRYLITPRKRTHGFTRPKKVRRT